MASTTDEAHDSGEQHQSKRKKRKVTRACDSCKNRKKACTGQIPCASCVRNSVRCTYDTAYNRGIAVPPKPSLIDPQDRCGATEPVQQHIIRFRSPEYRSQPLFGSNPNRTSQDDPQSIQDSGPSFSCPPSRRLSPEPEESTDVAGQYSGPVSAHSFLGRAIQKFSPGTNANVLSPDNGPDVSVFSFGDRRVSEVDPTQLSWPDRTKAVELSNRYFEFASPTYRVLHQGTVNSWIEECCTRPSLRQPPTVSAASKAAVLMVCAMACMFRPDHSGTLGDADDSGWRQSEIYYTMAQRLLANEAGAASLASVQARFITVLYLLSSSRVNKAWYVFGTVVQLSMALGLHRRQKPLDAGAVSPERLIARECEKRVLWCAFTLDKYLSLMLGRPRMLQEDDISQEFPAMLNDEDLTAQGDAPRRGRDCVMAASVFHAELSQILARAAKELYVHPSTDAGQQVETIVNYAEQISSWHDRLPHTLSGAIHASSLIPLFRRQLTVLQLAEYHALMFATRPFLLRDYARIVPEWEDSYFRHLSTCVRAARNAVDLSLYFVREQQLFSAFWYTQYIMFNALSIIYIYLIQTKRGRIPSYLGREGTDTVNFSHGNEKTLYEMADRAHHHLDRATVRNSPLWRYSTILQGLKGEVHRFTTYKLTDTSDSGSASLERGYAHGHNTEPSIQPLNGLGARTAPKSHFESNDNPGTSNSGSMISQRNHFQGDATLPELPFLDMDQFDLFNSFSNEKDVNLDFWTQMDSFPISFADP